MTDASGVGLGCVLMQSDKVIAYGSRQLKEHEKIRACSHCTCTKEVEALPVRREVRVALRSQELTVFVYIE